MRQRGLALFCGVALLALLWSVLWPFTGAPAGRLLGLIVLLGLALPNLTGSAPASDWRVTDSHSTKGLFFGLMVMALAIVVLEQRQPFYFSTDDNLAQFGPVMTAGARSFFQGVFPTWNPYQALGQPTTVTGVYALTYPVTYLSWLIAAGVLRNEGMHTEVFCILHLLVGYAAMYRLTHRQLGVRPVVAVIASLGFCLAGFFLVVARAWYYMVPAALWLPVIAERTTAQLRAPGIAVGTAVGTGLALGLFFHAGNAQLWVYAVMLYGVIAIGVVVHRFAGRERWQAAVVSFGIALAVAVAVAAPLMLPQGHFAADIRREVWGGGILPGLGSLGLPFPFVNSPHPNTWDDQGRGIHMGQLYFIGTLATLAGLWGVGRACRDQIAGWSSGPPPQSRAVRVLLALGLVSALELALGDASWAWPSMASLPMFNKFSNPFKFLPFVALFAAGLGAVVVEGFLRSLRGQRARLAATATLVVVAVVTTVLHVRFADSTFYTYSDRPWPHLGWTADLRKQSARVASLYPGRLNDAGYVAALGHNFASIYRVSSLEIYDPLVQFKPESAFANDSAHWRDYGVTHVLQFDDLGAAEVAHAGAVRLFKSGRVTVYALPNSRPLAWLDGAGLSAVPATPRWRGNGFSVGGLEPGGPDRRLTVNVLQREGFIARDQDGIRLATARDPQGRLTMKLRPTSTAVDVVYKPGGRFGYMLVAVLLVLGCLLPGWPAVPRWVEARVRRELRGRWR